ncbi:four helix bundle protein [Ekhidna sp.]|uniref:four helix bundle protein n=1 Tax=Ekhidna sp. TaxID=2608089 RepID=UPI003BAD85D5
MEKSKSFTELIVWQKAHALALEIYKITQNFPKEEMFGITSQIRRASVSVAANIAEGYKRRSANDKARFFNISEGSLDETKYFLILANDLGFTSESENLLEKCDEVAKLLYSYKTAILNSDS